MSITYVILATAVGHVASWYLMTRRQWERKPYRKFAYGALTDPVGLFVFFTPLSCVFAVMLLFGCRAETPSARR